MTTFTARASDLVDALANVLPHAASDGSLPQLAAVHLTLDEEGLVTLVATDRYSLAVVEAYTVGPFEPGSALIARADIVEMLKLAKAEKYGTVNLTVDGDRLTVSAGTGASFVRLLVDGQFPKWQSLMPSGDPVEVGVIGMGAQNFGKFAKLQRNGRTIKNASMRCTFRGATKPVEVTVDGLDDFRSIVMPVRLAA